MKRTVRMFRLLRRSHLTLWKTSVESRPASLPKSGASNAAKKRQSAFGRPSEQFSSAHILGSSCNREASPNYWWLKLLRSPRRMEWFLPSFRLKLRRSAAVASEASCAGLSLRAQSRRSGWDSSSDEMSRSDAKSSKFDCWFCGKCWNEKGERSIRRELIFKRTLAGSKKHIAASGFIQNNDDLHEQKVKLAQHKNSSDCMWQSRIKIKMSDKQRENLKNHT